MPIRFNSVLLHLFLSPCTSYILYFCLLLLLCRTIYYWARYHEAGPTPGTQRVSMSGV